MLTSGVRPIPPPIRTKGRSCCATSMSLGQEKIADGARYFVAMRLKREVAGVKKVHLSVRDVAFERFRTRRQKERIVLAPCGQKRRLVFAQIVLEFRIERDVALVVAEEIELNLVRARARQIIVVERISVWRNQCRIGHAVRVLPDCCFRREESAERIAVRIRRLFPVSPDGIPTFAQTLLIGVPILGDDGGDALWVCRGHPKTSRRTVIEYIDCKAIQADYLCKAVDDVRDIIERIAELVSIGHVCLTKSGKIGCDDMELPG